MISLTNTETMKLVIDSHPEPALRSLLSLRMAQLAQPDGADSGDAIHFFVFEAGDTLDRLEAELGFSPLQSAVDASVFGDPDFMPSWEWIEAHTGWFELAYVFDDDGSSAIIFVSRAVGVDPDLLALCSHWAD